MTSLRRATTGMAVGTIVSRVTGQLRNTMIVLAVGSFVFADTYSVANTVPNILYILLLGGIINTTLIPALARAAKEDDDGGVAYAQRLLTWACLALLVLTVLAVVAAPLVVRAYAPRGWSDRDVEVATIFARYCLPQIFFYGVFTVIGQILNVRGRFGPMMWAPILNNLVVIGTCVGFLAIRPWGATPNTATATSGELLLLGLGTTAGIAVQSLVLLPVLLRSGFPLRPRFGLRKLGLRKLGALAGWTLGFVAVNQVVYLLITRLATAIGKQAETAGLPIGGLLAYQNAYLIFLLPHGILTVSLMTAMLPRMSSAAAEGNTASIAADVNRGLRSSAVGTIPAAVAFAVTGPVLTAVLFGNSDGSRAIGHVLAFFAAGLVAFSGQYVALRAFYAQQDTRTPVLLQIVIGGLNAAGAWAAYVWAPLEWKLPAMAGAYAVAYLVGFCVTLLVLRRRIGRIGGSAILGTWLRLLLASVVAAIPALEVVLLGPRQFGTSWPVAVGVLTVALAVFGAVYVALASYLRVGEVTETFGRLVRR